MKNEYWKVMARNEDIGLWGTSDRIPTERLAEDLYEEYVDRFKYIKMIHCVVEEEIVRSNYLEENETL